MIHITRCYSKDSKLIAIIHNNAISEMTWHSNGLYIYWRRKVQEYNSTDTQRAGVIICDWTKTEIISQEIYDYVKRTVYVPIITEDNTTICDISDLEYQTIK